MRGRGWISVPSTALSKGIQHYVPDKANVQSWQDFLGLYDYAEHTESVMFRLPDESIIVDIGTYHGKSAAHMAAEAIKLHKNMAIYTIEPYRWTPHYQPHPAPSLHRNIAAWQAIGVGNYITGIVGQHTHIANIFENTSIQHINYDGGNNQDTIRQEIKAWIPKLKHQGSIAGVGYSAVKHIIDSTFNYIIYKPEMDIWVTFKGHYIDNE